MAVVDERLGCLGGQLHVGEGVGVDGVGGAAPGLHAGPEAVHEQLGVAHLDRADDPDRGVARDHSRGEAHGVAALVRPGGVGRDVGLAEGLHRGSPCEGGAGEGRGDLLEQAAVLGAVGDDKVVAVLCVVAQGHAGVLHDEGARRDGDLAQQPGVLHAVQGVDDGLAEGQVVLRAGCHHRSPQRLRHEAGHGRIACGSHVGGQVVGVVVLDHEPAVGEVDGVRASAHRARLDVAHQVVEDHVPLVDLVGHHHLGSDAGLVGLGAEPRDAVLAGHADGADRHLGGAGEHRVAVVDERLGCLGGQLHVGEGVGVDGVGGAAPGLHAGPEAVHEQLGVAHLDRADDPDRGVARDHSRGEAHGVAALVRPGGVGRDVGLAEGLHRGSPCEGGAGEGRGDLLEQAAVLGAVGDDKVVAVLCVVAQGHAGVLHDEGARRDGDLAQQPGVLHAVQGVDDGLAEGQVVLRAGCHHRSPQRLRPSHLCFCLGSRRRSGSSSLLSRGGGFGGFGLGRGGLGLSFCQRGLEFGHNLGVYGSLGCLHGLRQCLLGLGGRGGGLLSPGGGRISLGLSFGGFRLCGGRLGLCRGRGRFGFGLSGSGVSVWSVVSVVTA